MDAERVERWLDALTDAIEELASLNLGMDVAEAVRREEPSTDSRSTASIDLRCPTGSWRISIASDTDGCQTLARTLLGLEPEEEDLPDADVADAFGEVLNILAGGLKKRLSGAEGDIFLGLPEVRIGEPMNAEYEGRVLASTAIGPIRTDLMIAPVDS